MYYNPSKEEKYKEDIKKKLDMVKALKRNNNYSLDVNEDLIDEIQKELNIKKRKKTEKHFKKMITKNMKENKKDIDKEQIRKNQEKELKSFIDELGIIKVYDINKVLNKDIKFTDSSLKKIIGEQFSYHGVTTSIKETEDKKEENQEKKVKKKKKKNRNDKGEEKGEKSDNIKLCKKEK